MVWNKPALAIEKRTQRNLKDLLCFGQVITKEKLPTFFCSTVVSPLDADELICACTADRSISLIDLSIFCFHSLNASSAQRDIVLESEGMIRDSIVFPNVPCIL